MSTIKVDTLDTRTGSGNITVSRPLTGLSGSGASLTALNATELTSGTIPIARIADDAITNAKMADDAIGVAQLSATGTANNGVFLRGDNTWAAAGGVDGITSSADATAMTITSAEKVGIGITNPNSTFVVSDGGAYGLEFYPNDNNVSKILAYDRSGSAYRDFKISGNQVIFGYGTSGNNEAFRINADGIITMPKQSAFSASMPDTSNLAVGSFVKLNFNAEVFDQNADFNTSTNTFTAPVSGRYLFTMFVEAMEIDNQCNALRFDLNTSNDTLMEWSRTEPDVLNNADMSRFGACGSILANMDANDTAHVQVHITGGQAQMEVTASSRFEGVLIC